MKKNLYLFLFLVLCVLTFLNVVQADPAQVTRTSESARRMSRGLLNMTTSPLDIANSIEDTRAKEGILQGITYGTLKGVGTATQRFFYGFYELVTFYQIEKNRETFHVDYDSAVIRL